MKSFILPVDCPRCGNDLTHITSSITTGPETSAISRCPTCTAEWLVRVELLAVRPPRAGGDTVQHPHTGSLPYPTRGQYVAGCRCDGCRDEDRRYGRGRVRSTP